MFKKTHTKGMFNAEHMEYKNKFIMYVHVWPKVPEIGVLQYLQTLTIFCYRVVFVYPQWSGKKTALYLSTASWVHTKPKTLPSNLFDSIKSDFHLLVEAQCSKTRPGDATWKHLMRHRQCQYRASKPNYQSSTAAVTSIKVLLHSLKSPFKGKKLPNGY